MADAASRFATRALRLLPPEAAHTVSIKLMASGLGPRLPAVDDPALRVEAMGLDFPHPVGLAAGYDKHGEVMRALLGLQSGFVEIGGVTPLAQPGNPKPRLFRLSADKAVINRFGLNSDGAEVVADRLRLFREQTSDLSERPIIGVNLGANKESADRAGDYAIGVAAFASLADFLTINVSSPNTPGLRNLQSLGLLRDVIARAGAARGTSRTPILLKVAPDLAEQDVDDIADVALTEEIDGDRVISGLIIGNTTVTRSPNLKSPDAGEEGGLSGAPLFEMSTDILRQFRRRTGGGLTLVGCGGIATPDHAYAKIRAGADLLQLYSALIYEGPGLFRRIALGLGELLRRDGFAHISDAVGVDAT